MFSLNLKQICRIAGEKLLYDHFLRLFVFWVDQEISGPIKHLPLIWAKVGKLPKNLYGREKPDKFPIFSKKK